MARKPDKRKPVSVEDWNMIHRFAVSLERGRFNDYIELLQKPKQLFWKSFISGVGKGLGAIIGATVIVALIVAILAALGHWLPGQFGDFFRHTSDSIQTPTK